VRIYGFNQDGNRASASAIASILLIVALLVIVALDILQRRLARRGD
jgi:sulfate transport system permease protein